MMFYPMARAKFSRAQNVGKASRTRKMAKNEIFGALIMARAPKRISDSKTSIKIDAF